MWLWSVLVAVTFGLIGLIVTAICVTPFYSLYLVYIEKCTNGQHGQGFACDGCELATSLGCLLVVYSYWYSLDPHHYILACVVAISLYVAYLSLTGVICICLVLWRLVLCQRCGCYCWQEEQSQEDENEVVAV